MVEGKDKKEKGNMKKILSLFLCCLMVLTLTGCGGFSGDDITTYTYSSELDIKNLDSSDTDDGCSPKAIHAVIDGLTKTDKKGNIVNTVAKSEELSEDGLTHTYKLRKDVKWTNGDPVTTHDFVYSWQRIFRKKGSYYYMFADGIAGIEGAQELSDKIDAGEELTDDDLNSMGVKAIDDYTLEVKTTVRVSFFDELMAFPCFFPINEKFCEKQGDKCGKSAKAILGNGAFIMTNWESGSIAEFKKNEDYYEAKTVKIEKLVMKLVQDPKVAAQSFMAGETDYAPITSDLVDKYKDAGLEQVPEGFLYYLSVNFQNSDLANLNVRKAISLAINRKDLCENVLKDGSQVAGGFIPSSLATSPDGVDFRKDSGNFTSYDKKKAQESLGEGLKELGKNQITLRITYGTDEFPMDVFATYLQNALSKLDGIKVEMVATTKQDRIYNKQKNGDFDLAVTRWGPDYGDPTTYLTIALSTNSNNYGKWSNSEYDQLVGQVGIESNVTKRWQEMKDAEKILLDDYAYIPVFEKGAATLQNPKVKNLVIKPCRTISFEYVEKTE